jgi:hypothetical protein
MNLMMPHQPLKAQKEFYRRRQHLVLVAELYNIMNALQQEKRNAYLGTMREALFAG